MEETITNEELKKAIKSRKRMEILFIIQLVIFTGLMVFIITNILNSSNCSGGAADLKKEEIAAYNHDFEAYRGQRRGTQVKTLLITIRSHNLGSIDNSKIIRVINGKKPEKEEKRTFTEEDKNSASEILKDIKAGYMYNVEFGYDEDTELIVTCYIEKITNN